MKTYKYIASIILAISAIVLLSSCKGNFLQRVPQTGITSETFFNSVQDLQTYTHGFYSQIDVRTNDIGSDNVTIYGSSNEVYTMLRGNLSPQTVSGWNWGDLRSINYMLDHVQVGKINGTPAAVKNYIGIARFFRAWFYFKKVKRYSDVPWYSHAVPAGDSSLYKPADPRTVVVDSIMADLQYAVDHIKTGRGDGTLISKWSALQLMARFCLFEGTFRKYHPELNLQNTYKPFLKKAIWAAQQIMKSNNFKITGHGGKGYRALFTSTSLSNNKEIILWANYNEKLGVGNNTHAVLGWEWSLSRSLEESYLMKNGTPFTSVPGHDTLTFTEVFKNRDPRMAETIAYPGFKTSKQSDPYVAKPFRGGYDQLKFYPRDPSQRQGWFKDYTAIPIFRYAETLLIYAEAKAELGKITQADINKTINVIRSRVNMPPLNMAYANNHPDPRLERMYPDVSGPDKGVILEIRRERRVELACEGFRYWDLDRWGAGQLLAKAPEGMYVSSLGGIDVTGDGKPDYAILASPGADSPIADLPSKIRSNIPKYYLRNANGNPNSFYLTNGTSGFIAFTIDKRNPRQFIDPKYYYRPIPFQQLVLNPNLKQPFGW